ncbi:MAG: efflux RND transporter periplasmic adaptor subunit [Candidatus Aminicenantes bacterium]|nr:efflux RND transporter periplasmic adaptor subunit [Candidatus Aminicenantes bacterium]
MKKIVLFSFLGLLAAGALYMLLAGNGNNAPAFKLVAVQRGDIAEKALAVGTIEPEQEIKVKSTISGIVAEVMFKVGDQLKEGQPLFKVSPNPTPLEYVEARRSMEMAEVGRGKAANDRSRLLQLFKDDLISKSDMEACEAQWREAALKFDVARDRFELLEKGRIQMATRSIDSIVKAPIAGIVLSQAVFQGDPVVPLTNFQPGTELCSMADMGRLLFKGTVDEIDVGKLEPPMKAAIQVGALGDTRVEGVLERIYPKAKKEGNATLFDIEIAITRVPGLTLRAGYSATAEVKIQERRDTLILPERLLLFENGKKYVEVPKGKEAVRREVRTGLSDGLNVEILSGLKEKEQVVERPPREIE